MKLAYWKKYDRLFKKFSHKSLYKLVFEFVQGYGIPYEKTSNFGPKPKVSSTEYAAFMIFMIIMHGATYRKMELDSETYLGKHIDHSTFSINFEKIPYEFFLGLIEETGAYLDRLLENSDQYVVDSTAITSPLKFKTMNKGKLVDEKIEFRSHVIASVHKEDNCVCIRTALGTTKRIADCEGAKRMLDNTRIHNVTLHGDRGYDYERVYESCFKNNIKPNIRPHYRRVWNDSCRYMGIIEYDDEGRKKNRGLIEVIFGGLTNAGLIVTRLRKEVKIIAYSVIILLRHNILNIARNMT